MESVEEREYIIEKFRIRAEHIFSSPTTFEVDLNRVTSSHGVNIVFNARSSETKYESWRFIAPFGRFLDAGFSDKGGFGEHGLHVISRNASFMRVDLSLLVQHKPELVGRYV